MSTPDLEAIENFDSSYKRAARNFNSSEYLYFSDYNQGSYQSGIIKFDTLTSKDQFWIPADSYLAMNVQMQSAPGGVAYIGNEPLAWRNSILNAITGIQINSGSGQTLVFDQSVQFINNIRRLLDTSWEAQMTNCNELQLWKDTSMPIVDSTSITAAGVQGSASSDTTLSMWGSVATGNDLPSYASDQVNEWVGVGAVAPSPTVGIGLKTAFYNSGLDKKVRLFKSAATFNATTHTYNQTLFIPLRYIHPFFEKLDFPIINTRFQINFYTPFNVGTSAVTTNCPFLHGGIVTTSATTSPLPAVWTAASDVQATILGPTFLYYRKVTYLPEDNAKVSEMIKAGHKISLEYMSMDFYPSIALNQAPGNSRIDLVSSSTVAPVRIWALALPQGYVQGTIGSGVGVVTALDPYGTAYRMQTVPFAANNYLTRGNILINSQRYYDNDLGNNGLIGGAGLPTSFHDFWEVLEEQTVGHGFKENLGSLLGLNDFYSTYNFNVYDVSRLRDRLPNPSESVNIQHSYMLGPVTAAASTSQTNSYTSTSDMLYIVERNTVAQFVFSSGAVSIAIGSQAT